jgi:hypothetical protein
VPTRAPKDPPSKAFVATIVDLARMAKARRKEAEAATVLRNEFETEIKELLRADGRFQVSDGVVTITWSPVKGRPSYNWPAIRAEAEKAGIDIEKFSEVGQRSDRLVIAIRGEKTANPAAKAANITEKQDELR